MDSRLIPLGKGQSAIVDASDYDWLLQWKWVASWDPTVNDFYARRCSDGAGMHRVIMGLGKGDPRTVDHETPGNTLDNRRANLRIATRSQQQHNTRKRRDNTSGVKGVSRKGNRWVAQIMLYGKQHHGGYFASKELAGERYKELSEQKFGEFARLA